MDTKTEGKIDHDLKIKLSEYLDTFVVLGFTERGERVICEKIECERDRLAIFKLIESLDLAENIEATMFEGEDEND